MTEQLTIMEIFTRAAKDKMYATQKQRILMEYFVQENLTHMAAHTLVHLRKYCVLPKKDPLDVKKRPHVKTEQQMTKENTAQILQTAPQFVHPTTSTVQEELMMMDARTQTFALKSTKISMVMYAQYIVQRTVKMTKFSALEQETQSMAVTAKTHVNQRTLTNGEKLQDLTAPDGAQLSVSNMKSCAPQW